MLGSQLTSMSGVSSRNLLLTDTRASSGHSWNQSMAVQLTTAGNLLARTRRVEPTGEKHRTTWGRTAVAEWGVPAVRVGAVSPGAPHDCKDSAADQRFAVFPLSPSMQELVCGCAACASHQGWYWVPFGGCSQQLSSARVGVPGSAQHSVWPWNDPLCPQGGQYWAVLPCASGAGGTWGVSENTFCPNPPSCDETLVFCGLLQRGFGSGKPGAQTNQPGEQIPTFNWRLTFSINIFQQFSFVSSIPRAFT